MIISKQTALEGIESGTMVYDGLVAFDDTGKGAWIIRDNDSQQVHHVEIWDSEPMSGCVSCGLIVDPEPDARGIGCHCPNCKATL